MYTEIIYNPITRKLLYLLTPLTSALPLQWSTYLVFPTESCYNYYVRIKMKGLILDLPV